MSDASKMARAAAPLAEIIRDIKPDQLGAPTPCAEYDVRKLVNHLLFWGPSLEGAARKEALLPPAATEAEVDLTEGDWADAVEAHLDRTVSAWSHPEAWEGMTHLADPTTQLPSPMIGGMVVGELVVHGWDLARATGQLPAWDDDLMRYLHDEIANTAEQGRHLGIYGPEIAVPTSSSTLDRLLGLTGRDPGWIP